jgi:hypothetical protein
MSQNTIDNVLVLNARNDFQRPATPATGLYVNIENPPEALRPDHSSMAFGWYLYFNRPQVTIERGHRCHSREETPQTLIRVSPFLVH